MLSCIRTSFVSGPCRACGDRDDPAHIVNGDKPGEYWFYCSTHCPVCSKKEAAK